MKLLAERQQHIEQMESKVEELVTAQKSELERIAALTREEAKGIILKEVENELVYRYRCHDKRSGNTCERRI